MHARKFFAIYKTKFAKHKTNMGKIKKPPAIDEGTKILKIFEGALKPLKAIFNPLFHEFNFAVVRT